MKMKKLNSTLLIAMLSISSLYSEPCKNCVATILKSPEHKTLAPKFKAIKKSQDDSSKQYTNDGLIALDDNEDNSIVITLDNIESNISSNNSDTKKLYACSDDMAKTLICDDVTKVCECV